MEMTPAQEKAIKEQVGPMLEALGMDMSQLDDLFAMGEEYPKLKRTVRIIATWARAHDPEGWARAQAVILDAEAKEAN